jgi:predicted transcriptional regulator
MDIKKSFSRVQRTETVSRVLGYLRGASDVLPMVFDGNRCYGFVNERLLISTRIDTNRQIKGFDVRVRTVSDSNSVSEIAQEMLRSYCPHAPYGKNDREESIEGYIEADTVSRELLKEKTIGRNAGSIAKSVVTMRKNDSVGKAINLLKNFRAVPIVDDEDRLYGCIEQRGNLIELAMDRERPRQGTYMSTNEEGIFKRSVIQYSTKLTPQCDAGSALNEELMETIDTYGYCFVCTDGRPSGLITPLDILHALV